MKAKDLVLNKLPNPCSDGLAYALTDGGYLEGKDFSDDPGTIEAIDNAADIVSALDNYFIENDLEC